MSVVKACTFDTCRRRLAFGLFAGPSSGEWAWSWTMGQFPRQSDSGQMTGQWQKAIKSRVQVKELRVLGELFFAYNRDKYEVLVINSISDSMTYPKDILEHFLNGEWTVSLKGRPFHNQALDEAHETVINRKLKQVTTRPSHFRMVNLADFMAYLDNVCTGLDSCIPRKHKQKKRLIVSWHAQELN